MIKILAVDDNQQNLILLERLLKSKQYSPILAKNGAEALQLARENPPALIISDILMPVMDGFELCRRWKADQRLKNIPFVFFTATYASSQDEQLGLRLGADRYIIKPQEPTVLLKIIEEVLEEYRTHEKTPRQPFGEELEYFRQYNQVLFHKLEKKMTDLVQLNQELQKAREECDQDNQTKNLFIAMLSHELRTPLTAILNWTQLLRMGKIGPLQVPKAAASIEKSALDQKRLIDDLIDISKIVSGKLTLNQIETDITELASAEFKNQLPLTTQKQIEITSSIDVGTGKFLMDSFRIKQIVNNLMSNAVKFVPKGGKVHISILARPLRLSITVSDTGIGIRREHLDRIFEPFHQVDSSRTRSYGGLGMGLTIAKKLVELMNGTIRAESAGEGQGATFRVDLPLIACHKTEGVSELRKDLQSESVLQLKNKVLALVDDDPATLESLSLLFRSQGMKVITTSNAAEGFQAVIERRPDILISDIAMPGEDGYSLMRKIRDLTNHQPSKRIPAIALTAYADKDAFDQAKEAGFDECLAKPVNLNTLITLVIATLQKRTQLSATPPS